MERRLNSPCTRHERSLPGRLRSVNYYEAFSDLAGVVLEDSWVLDVAPGAHGVAIRLEVALTPEHSRYGAPRPGEQHCYRMGWLSVRGEGVIDVRLSGNRPAIDATGERDFGHVDTFVFNSTEGHWELAGDWGVAAVRTPEVTLLFD